MLLNVLLILLPLGVGYLIPLSSARLIKLVNQSLGKMVYLILFLMGLGLAYVENLGSNLAVIFKVAGVMLAAITACNLTTAHAIFTGEDTALARKLLERRNADLAITQEWLDQNRTVDTSIALDTGTPGSMDYFMSVRGPLAAPTLRAEPGRGR